MVVNLGDSMILRAAKTFVSAFSLFGAGQQDAPEPEAPRVIKAQVEPPSPPTPPIQLPTVQAIVESIQKPKPEPTPPPPKPNPKPRPVKRNVPYPPRRPATPTQPAPTQASWGLPPREFVPYVVSESPRSRRVEYVQPATYSEPQIQSYEPVANTPIYQPSFSMPLGGVSGFGGLGPATGGCAGGSCR